MKTFQFYHKNSSAVLTLSANNFNEAKEELSYAIKDTWGWRCDDEDGEGEEE